MTEPVSLAERRWNKVDHPAAHQISDMLRITLDRLERGEIKPQHMIIMYGDVADDIANPCFMQAGGFDAFGQLGLVEMAKKLLTRPV